MVLTTGCLGPHTPASRRGETPHEGAYVVITADPWSENAAVHDVAADGRILSWHGEHLQGLDHIAWAPGLVSASAERAEGSVDISRDGLISTLPTEGEAATLTTLVDGTRIRARNVGQAAGSTDARYVTILQRLGPDGDIVASSPVVGHLTHLVDTGSELIATGEDTDFAGQLSIIDRNSLRARRTFTYPDTVGLGRCTPAAQRGHVICISSTNDPVPPENGRASGTWVSSYDLASGRRTVLAHAPVGLVRPMLRDGRLLLVDVEGLSEARAGTWKRLLPVTSQDHSIDSATLVGDVMDLRLIGEWQPGSPDYGEVARVDLASMKVIRRTRLLLPDQSWKGNVLVIPREFFDGAAVSG